MSAWIKISRPNVEVGEGFTQFQSIVVNLEEADSFAIQTADSITFFIQGKAYVVLKQFDASAYEAVIGYAQRFTGIELP